MDPEQRLERLQEALDQLIETNETSPVVVEGPRDEQALRELGLQGDILVYNQGRNMTDFADRLRGPRDVVVLFDWDRKGGQLARLLQQKLSGVVRMDLELRKEFARVSLVKCVEDLPSALRTLDRRAMGRKTEERTR